MREQWERQYPHEWIVIHAQELIGHNETYGGDREGAREQDLNLARCLLQKLNATPPIILS